MIDVHSPCTQAQFGELVNISQQKVSQLLADGTIKAGDSLGVWLIDYVGNLREQAAGRGADGELAFQRSEFARVSRERAEIKLALERREYAPVSLLTVALATVGRQLASGLESLPAELHKLAPDLTPEATTHMERKISRMCDDLCNLGASLFDDTEGETLGVVEDEPQEIGEGAL
jgi:terminase small subunit / prophage DNA-packing protein